MDANPNTSSYKRGNSERLDVMSASVKADSLLGKAMDDGSSSMKRQETKKATRFWQNREFNVKDDGDFTAHRSSTLAEKFFKSQDT